MNFKFTNNQLILLLSFIYYLPVILLNEYFLDDHYRVLTGDYAWVGDYRPLADYLYYILGLSFDVVDTFPIPYIIQYFIISIILSYLVLGILNRFEVKKELISYIIIICFFIFLNPFFLQNLYFRFDSIVMVFTIMIILLLLIVQQIKIEFFALLIVLFLYQSSIIGYPIIVCINVIYLILKNNTRGSIYRYSISRIFVFFFSIFVFYLISSNFIQSNSYASSHFNIVESILKLKQNIVLSLSNLSFSNSLLDYVLIYFSLIFTVVFVFEALKNNTKIFFIDKIFFSFFLCFLLLIAVLNINIFLEIPRLYSRTYIGFGFFLFFTFFVNILLISYNENNKDLNKYFYLIKLNILVFLFILINISYVNFNYFKNKIEFNKKIINFIEYDLNTLNLFKFNNFIIGGEIVETKREKILSKRYPVIKTNFSDYLNTERHRVIYEELKNNGYNFRTYGLYQLSNRKLYNEMIKEKAVIVRKDYDIVVKSESVFIFFKKEGNRQKVLIDKNRLN